MLLTLFHSQSKYVICANFFTEYKKFTVHLHYNTQVYPEIVAQ